MGLLSKGKNSIWRTVVPSLDQLLPAALSGGVLWPLQQTPAAFPVGGITAKQEALEYKFMLGICCLQQCFPNC